MQRLNLSWAYFGAIILNFINTYRVIEENNQKYVRDMNETILVISELPEDLRLIKDILLLHHP